MREYLYTDRKGNSVYSGDLVKHFLFGFMAFLPVYGYAKEVLENGRLVLVNSMESGPETMARFVSKKNYIKYA